MELYVMALEEAIFFNGLPEMNIQDIAIKNVTITSTIGAEISETNNLTFQNVNIINTDGPALILRNAKNIDITRFSVKEGLKNILQVEGQNTSNISVKLCSFSRENCLISKEVLDKTLLF